MHYNSHQATRNDCANDNDDDNCKIDETLNATYLLNNDHHVKC